MFFFNDTATTEIYTLSLHDALPISFGARLCNGCRKCCAADEPGRGADAGQQSRKTQHDEVAGDRSEEHTSELQSHLNFVCRLLLEKEKHNVDYSVCTRCYAVDSAYC